MSTTLHTLGLLAEMRVVFAVIALIAAVDVSLRLTDSHLSGNLAHVESIPKVVAGAGRPAQASLLLLGNSLTNNAVAPEIVHAHLPDVTIAKITPDATGLWDWQCLLDHQVVGRSDVQFDTVMIGFAWHLLSDQSRLDASRLGALYCSWSDLLRVRGIGLKNSGEIGEFIAAKVLRTYALRDTLRNRFFQISVPHYIQFTQANNAARVGGGERSASTQSETYTYEALSTLLDRLRSKGTRVVVVAMPVQQEYELDSELRSLSEHGAFDLVDLRKLAEIGSAFYLDGLHLNPTGQEIVSRKLASYLATERFRSR